MTTDARTLANILDTDAATAEATGAEHAISNALELAPFSYAELRDANERRELAGLLAGLSPDLLRPQAVRFLVERKAAHGALWGWGDVDDVARRFERLANQHRAADLAQRIGAAQAAKIKQALAAESADTLTVDGERWAVVRRSPCGRLVMASNGKSQVWQRFAVALDGEIDAIKGPNARLMWENGERWLAYRLDEEAWAATAPVTPAAIDTTPALSAELVDAVLGQRQEDAQREQAKAAAQNDAAGAAYARARSSALGKARGYLARAARAGRTLATQLLNGDWQVVGSEGDRYTLTLDELTLSCSCRHGELLREALAAAARGKAASPPRGVCWHSELVAAAEEAQDQQALPLARAA